MVPPRVPHAQREIARSNEQRPPRRAVAVLTCENSDRLRAPSCKRIRE